MWREAGLGTSNNSFWFTSRYGVRDIAISAASRLSMRLQIEIV